MAELKYPVGIQTFSNLIEEGYAYVDKTRYIPMLLKQGKYIFLSRPRRFGKSLFTSTLKAFFQGRRELFKGLDVDRGNLDWTPSPVLHFDFNSENYKMENGLDLRLDSELRDYERIYGRDKDDISPSQRFKSIIRKAFEQTGRKVVILIDEYDKPLLELEDFSEIFERNQSILKSFFGNLKSMDEYIRFSFITGVARFSKVSIFSDLNNLDDISMDDPYADICGLTREELEKTFQSGIEALAEERGETPTETRRVLRDYYDGYLFTPKGSRLYNPYSLLKALNKRRVDPYWFDTGTPTFLVRLIRSNIIDPTDINDCECTREELMQVRLGAKDPIPLMFQTGYLTIDHYDEDLETFTLCFPNREVEKGFAKDLLPLYIEDSDMSGSPFNVINFRRDLFNGNPQAFMKRLASVFKDMPYEDNNESVYRAVTYLICKLCSLDTRAEQHSYRGRSDMEVMSRRYIYIFEFKYDESVRTAIDQIHSRNYAGRYAFDPRTVFLIGVNYDSSKNTRGLSWEIEELA